MQNMYHVCSEGGGGGCVRASVSEGAKEGQLLYAPSVQVIYTNPPPPLGYSEKKTFVP